MTERFQDQAAIHADFSDAMYQRMLQHRYGIAACRSRNDLDDVVNDFKILQWLNKGGELKEDKSKFIPLLLVSDDTNGYCLQEYQVNTSVTFTIGDGVKTVFTLPHNFYTTDVMIEVYEISSGTTQYPDVQRLDSVSIKITFDVPPSANQFKVIITKASVTATA